MKTGFVVFAHGSSVDSANDAVRATAAEAARMGGMDPLTVAFLELAKPTLGQAVEDLASRGVERIVVVPYFLTLGIHLQRDLPGIVRALGDIHPGVEITVTEPLDGHPALTQIVVDRALKALADLK